MARIVDTNTTPPTVHDSVDVLDFLDPQYVKSDGNKRWHELLKREIADKLKPGFLLNPDLSAVRNADGTAKAPTRYWKQSDKSNALVVMDVTEKAAVDARLNPPDPDRDMIESILAKGDANVQASDLKPLLLALARKVKARGAL